MNDAKLQLDAGNLTAAVESAINLVKTNPANEAARIFLFELSCFSGDWDRAARQLDVIGHQDVNSMIGSKIYEGNFKAERDRMKYFADGVVPEFMTSKPAYIDDLFAANNRLREGKDFEARGLLDQVEENRPAFKVSINGEGFSDFRDYNDLTMCVFEVLLRNSYIWIPFEQVVKIELFKPKTLRDLYWIQAKVDLLNGTGGEMFLPALYSGSWKSTNDQVRLGRMTDWRDAGSETYIGEGLRAFWMDGKDKSILDIETIEFVREKAAE
ncbi:MAG: type VI secretion system accessory protein TagJ [Pyrinomonadaceae bacterium]